MPATTSGTSRLRGCASGALQAERAALLGLWRDDYLRDDVKGGLERELDLEQARLTRALRFATPPGDRDQPLAAMD